MSGFNTEDYEAEIVQLQQEKNALAARVARLEWRLKYISENRNDQTAIACALECPDSQADEMSLSDADGGKQV